MLKLTMEHEDLVQLQILSDCADQVYLIPESIDNSLVIWFLDPDIWIDQNDSTDEKSLNNQPQNGAISCDVIIKSVENEYTLGRLIHNFLLYRNIVYSTERLFLPERAYQKRDEELPYVDTYLSIDQICEQKNIDSKVTLSMQYLGEGNNYMGYELIRVENDKFESIGSSKYKLSENCDIYQITNMLNPEDVGNPYCYIKISEIGLRSLIHGIGGSNIYTCLVKNNEIIAMYSEYMP